jgi:hypothetical protein
LLKGPSLSKNHGVPGLERDAITGTLRSFPRLVGSAVITLLAIAGFLAYSLNASHERYQAGVQSDLQNLTLNLERNFFARLQSADLLLRSAAQGFERISAQPQAQQDAAFTSLLMTLQHQLPDAPEMRASDQSGLVRFGSGADPGKHISISHRQFFKDATHSQDLVIGLPLTSRISQRWVLPLARQLRKANGEFGGVAYLNLDLADFTRTLASLNVGKQGVITLFNVQRQVLLRIPEDPRVHDEHPLTLSAPATLASTGRGQKPC